MTAPAPSAPLPPARPRAGALVPALALALAAALAAPALPARADTAAAALPRTIVVTGEGRAEAVPDMATVTLGMTAEAPTAAEALRATSEAITKALAVLDAAGIEARDRQTTGLSLSPVWDYGRDGSRPPRITGYRASNGLAVRVRDLSGLGALLDAVVADGANQLAGLTFSLSDPVPAMDAARRNAVADARRKAELYAEAAGVGLGPLIRLSEAGTVTPRPMSMRSEMVLADAAPVPIAEGEVALRATVELVFEIAP